MSAGKILLALRVVEIVGFVAGVAIRTLRGEWFSVANALRFITEVAFLGAMIPATGSMGGQSQIPLLHLLPQNFYAIFAIYGSVFADPSALPFAVWVSCIVLRVAGILFFRSALNAHRGQTVGFIGTRTNSIRQVTTWGPYSVVRHPLYLTYIVHGATNCVLSAAHPLPFSVPVIGIVVDMRLPAVASYLFMVATVLLGATQEETHFSSSETDPELRAAYQRYQQSGVGMVCPNPIHLARRLCSLCSSSATQANADDSDADRRK